MMSIAGSPGLPLERAVLGYACLDDGRIPGGRSVDLGLGIVVGAPSGDEVPVWDAGSGEQRSARLEAPLLIFGWVDSAAVERITEVEGPSPDAVQLLRRIGYGPFSRPLFLRAGFRDVALDLDPHEGTAVRLNVCRGRVVRIHLDYGMGLLVVQTSRFEPDPQLRLLLSESFPGWPLHFAPGRGGPGMGAWYVQIPGVPDMAAVRCVMRSLRQGLLQMMSRYDQPRYRAVCDSLQGFGERDILGHVGAGSAASGPSATEGGQVH